MLQNDHSGRPGSIIKEGQLPKNLALRPEKRG